MIGRHFNYVGTNRIVAAMMKDIVRRDSTAHRIVSSHNNEAADLLMRQSIDARAELSDAQPQRRLRGMFLIANVIVWIAIVALARWLIF